MSIILSKRLLAIAQMVTPGSVPADIGTDHGYIPIYLVQEGITKRALAMDVRPGPLDRAREHVRAYGLEDQIELRLSDGAGMLRPGEADTLIIAGMGGALTRRILEEGAFAGKMDGIWELVLGPQSELPKVRGWLWENGFRIADEDMVVEDGKYYPIIKAVRGAGAQEIGAIGDGDIFREGEAVRTGDGKISVDGDAVRTGDAEISEDGDVVRAGDAEISVDGGAVRTGDVKNSGDSVTADTDKRIFGSCEPLTACKKAKSNTNRTDARFREADLKDVSLKCALLYGPVLLRRRHPVLIRYLEREASICRKIRGQICSEGAAEGNEKRLAELEERMRMIEEAFKVMQVQAE